MKNITEIFPRHVLCIDNICEDNISEFKSHLLENYFQPDLHRDDFSNVDTSHRLFEKNLRDDPVFVPLIQVIKSHAFEFACFLGYGIERAFMLEITNMWVNFSDGQDYNFPHIHPGSVISGAYYVENEVESNYLTFFDQYSAIDFPTNLNETNDIKKDFQCKKSRLLMFRSDLPHGNTPQMKKGQKITISFNLR